MSATDQPAPPGGEPAAPTPGPPPPDLVPSSWSSPAAASASPSAPVPTAGRRLVGAALVVALVSGAIGAAAGVAVGRASSSRRVAAPVSPPLGGGGSLNASAVAARVTAAVANVNTTLAGQAGRAAGTAMVLTSSGDLVTNNHVIDGAGTISVQIGGTGPSRAATVVGYDVTDDVAVLHVKGVSGLKTIQPGGTKDLRVGDPVVAVGNALGRSGPPTVTQGTISALDQTITAGDPTGSAETLDGLIQMNAPILPGESGGALINRAGAVIGMNTAAAGSNRRRVPSDTGFAIPIDTVLSIARQIEVGHASSTVHVGARALLGVQLEPDASGSDGALLAGVEPGTPAAKAGLVGGDRIVSVGGKSVSSAAQLRAVLDGQQPGQRTTIEWIDPSGTRHSAAVQLTAGPPA